MAYDIEVEHLEPGQVYRTINGRGERRLRRVKGARRFTSGTVPYVIVENLDPRTDTRETGTISMPAGTKVEVVSLVDGDDWETDVLSRLDDIKDGESVTFWGVGSDLYA